MCLSVLCSNTFFVFASSDEFHPDEYDIVTFEEMDTSNGQYKVHWLSQVGSYSYGEFYTEWVQIDSYAGSDSLNFTGARNINVSTMEKYIRDQFVVSSKGNTKIANKGSNISFSLDGIQMAMIGYNSAGNVVRYSHFNPSNMAEIGLYVYDKSGNSQKLETSKVDFNVTNSDGTITIGADFSNVPFDVYKMNIALVYYPASCFDNNNGDTSLTSTSWNVSKITRGWGYIDSKLTINGDDNVSGLLSSILAIIQGIIQGLNNIFGKIGEFMDSVGNSFTSLFSKLGAWFSELGDSISSFMSSVGGWFSSLFQHIIELPGKVWDVFEKGLKALFVPDEEYIQSYKGKWEMLLADRFGGLYEANQLVHHVLNQFTQVSFKSDTVEFPSATIPLPDGNEFTFGGYQVDIVPDGFSYLQEVVKMAVNIICTLAFVFTMKRKFEKLIVGGSS